MAGARCPVLRRRAVTQPYESLEHSPGATIRVEMRCPRRSAENLRTLFVRLGEVCLPVVDDSAGEADLLELLIGNTPPLAVVRTWRPPAETMAITRSRLPFCKLYQSFDLEGWQCIGTALRTGCDTLLFQHRRGGRSAPSWDP